MWASAGMTLLELLCVTAVMGVLMILTIQQWQAYRQQSDRALVESDLATLRSALRRYYFSVGCQADGAFPATKSKPDLVRDLHVSILRRPPWIVAGSVAAPAYFARIRQRLRTVKSGEQKWWSVLEVGAIFNAKFSQAKLEGYRRMFRADRIEGRALIWRVMPENSLARAQLKAFKRQKMDATQISVRETAAYCWQ